MNIQYIHRAERHLFNTHFYGIVLWMTNGQVSTGSWIERNQSPIFLAPESGDDTAAVPAGRLAVPVPHSHSGWTANNSSNKASSPLLSSQELSFQSLEKNSRIPTYLLTEPSSTNSGWAASSVANRKVSTITSSHRKGHQLCVTVDPAVGFQTFCTNRNVSSHEDPS